MTQEIRRISKELIEYHGEVLQTDVASGGTAEKLQ